MEVRFLGVLAQHYLKDSTATHTKPYHLALEKLSTKYH